MSYVKADRIQWRGQIRTTQQLQLQITYLLPEATLSAQKITPLIGNTLGLHFRALVRCDRPGGRVIVSLPNIAFIANRLTQILVRWERRDHGALDRTHLRFFTRKPVIELLETAGLRAL